MTLTVTSVFPQAPGSVMGDMHKLVVFYSRQGRVRQFGQVLAARLDAAVEEIRTPCIGAGSWGCVQAGWSALLTRPVTIETPRHDPADFDLVVIGFPTWAGRVAPPIRSYLSQHAEDLGAAAYFTMLKGPADNQVFGEVARLTGREPENSLALTRADRDSGRDSEKIGSFVADLAETAKTPARRREVNGPGLLDLVSAIGAVGPS